MATSSLTHDAPDADGQGDARQFVTFYLGEQEFGVDIQSVREFKVWQPTTALPNTPEHVLGVLNLRGQIITVFDLTVRLGKPAQPIGASQVIVVVEIGDRCLGLVVDRVSDILTIQADAIRATPTTGGDGDPLLNGLIARSETHMVAILNLAAIAGAELGELTDGLDDLEADAA